MKILFVIRRWAGGVGSYTYEVQRELEKRGHKVEVISREDDLKASYLEFGKLVAAVKKKMTKHTILYTQDWSIAMPLLFMPNHVCCFHGINPEKIGKFGQNAVAMVLKKQIVVVGESLKSLYPEALLNEEGVERDTFYPLSKAIRIPKTVGFANWKTSEYNFSKIKTAVEKAGYQLVIAEHLDKEHMNEFYNMIETFISLPPNYTGFGLVWLEAMSAGVPRIIGNNYGVGAKLPISKIEHYKSIVDALKKARTRNYLGWLEANPQYSWENHVTKLEELFEKVLQ